MKRRILAATVVVIAACGNVESGPGWELWAFDRAGPTYSVLVAETPADVARIWERFDLPTAKPTADFSEQVVIGLGHAVSGSCPGIEFGGLVVSGDRVFGEFALEENPNGCTADANSAMFWLVVDRSALPERFTLSLTEEDICGGCDEDVMEVDLTSDAPDGSQWWAGARLVVAVAGDPPTDHHAVRTVYADRTEVLALAPADWTEDARWLTVYEEEWPDRIEGFTAECVGGPDCIEDPDRVIPTGPECGTDLADRDRDRTALITFSADRCSVELLEGAPLLGG